MAIPWIGSDGLLPLLDRFAVVIVNATTIAPGLTLTSAAAVLHGSDGSRNMRHSTELALGVGESATLDGDRPTVGVIGVETILRVASTASRVITEVYLHSDETRTAAVDTIELGVIMTEEAPADAIPIPEVDGVSAYIRIAP
jgi:hypothetical protein